MTRPPTRRATLGAGLAAGCASTQRVAVGPMDDVARYEAFGDHRTGTDADHATARWLARRLTQSGFDASLHPFPIDIFAFEHASAMVDGRPFEAFPVWPATALSLEGELRDASAADAAQHIVLVTLPYSANATLASPAYGAPLRAAAASGARAVVAITEGPTNDIIALNADLQEPLAAPVLLVGGRHGEDLRRTAQERRVVRLDVRGRSERGEANNIIARRDGRGHTIVVSTPVSGWFGCAGERGAGVAIFLALAAWARTALANPLVFAATSGHEFEGLGTQHLFEHHLPAPEHTALWLHLGANLASVNVGINAGTVTSSGAISATRYAGATAPLLDNVAGAFVGQAGYDRPFDLDARPAPGDVALYRERGYTNLIGLVGASPLHHTRLDRAAFVSPQALEQITAALMRLLSA